MPASLADLTRIFGRIGLLSFGGPAAQIAMMHRELVDERRWLTEAEYLRGLSFCMMLPGPEAMQLATWAGWKQRGLAGGLIAGGLFVLPGALVVLALAMVYASFGTLPLVQALFLGVQAAVVVVVVEALLRVAKRALKGRMHWAIAVLAFAGLFLFNLPFPVIILAAGLWGALALPRAAAPADLPPPPAGMVAATLRTALVWAAIWLLPLGLLALAEGGILTDIGVFFSQLAVVTFGGAYAVLAWMTQAVVQDKGWLTLPQMIDGLGLAETTPGPLILVTEFVGYLAAHREGGILYGIAGALVTLWVTFVPCFLWIFAGAPWIDRLAAAPRLSAALAGITAAVVGVIANLALWFTLHVLFDTVESLTLGPLRLVAPVWASLDALALALALAAGVMLLRLHINLPLVLAVCALASAGLGLI
ncbi:chromate efflux transporter [Fertoebacter nigrum]|uniref:Chromate efflux transporter n=1 Tax=Fertoeibacter niger TaxID=2656921 RepID=A0A8X8H102_9RHOB|nr:chromate efflux transporter [Fertoeibacter niger]NUB43553.1 chromate efflux transporter [Fertoeibacter niger]